MGKGLRSVCLCLLYLCVWPAWHKHVCVIVPSVFPCAERLSALYTAYTPSQTYSTEWHTYTREYVQTHSHSRRLQWCNRLTPTDWSRDLYKHVIKSAYRFKHRRHTQRHIRTYTYAKQHTHTHKVIIIWKLYLTSSLTLQTWSKYTRVKLLLRDQMNLIVLSFCFRFFKYIQNSQSH